jgi:transcriptional regulator with XRE-family HTH domain
MKGRARSYKVNLNLGKTIRRLRKRMGVSQEELAARAGIHRTYMGKIERGESNPPVQTVSKVAKALRVKLSDLF